MEVLRVVGSRFVPRARPSGVGRGRTSFSAYSATADFNSYGPRIRVWRSLDVVPVCILASALLNTRIFLGGGGEGVAGPSDLAPCG